MKAGDWVLATRKSIYPHSLNLFLEDYPLGIAKIWHIYANGIIVLGYTGYSFKEEDLILLKEK